MLLKRLKIQFTNKLWIKTDLGLIHITFMWRSIVYELLDSFHITDVQLSSSTACWFLIFFLYRINFDTKTFIFICVPFFYVFYHTILLFLFFCSMKNLCWKSAWSWPILQRGKTLKKLIDNQKKDQKNGGFMWNIILNVPSPTGAFTPMMSSSWSPWEKPSTRSLQMSVIPSATWLTWL